MDTIHFRMDKAEWRKRKDDEKNQEEKEKWSHEMICSQLCIKISLQGIVERALIERTDACFAHMRNQTTADPKKFNQQLCKSVLMNIEISMRSIYSIVRVSGKWKGRTSSSGRATRMWDENGSDVMDKWDAQTQRREQGTKITAPGKFSPEDLFLIRRTSLGWIPCSWSCARICQQGEKKITIHCHKQHTYESSHHYGD